VIAILTPVLGRAHQIAPLAKNLSAATDTPYRLITICSPGDAEAIAACKSHADVTLEVPWFPGRADYAKKLAYGYMHVDEPWIFQSATDLIFHPGWDAQAMLVAKRSGCGVIGTNDLGNPLVKRGKHSTHSLISRAYLDRWGGVADGTGAIFSEAYDHQWTDSEFIETALLRREFAFARRAVVEHMHPHWKKGEMDATYEKATRETNKDQTLFMRRRGKVVRLVTEQKRTKR
jgi:hypothetical protein